jgi:hypothetical protein
MLQSRMTNQKPDVILSNSRKTWQTTVVDTAVSSMNKVSFLDFNFYPVKHAIVDDVLAFIPFDVEKGLDDLLYDLGTFIPVSPERRLEESSLLSENNEADEGSTTMALDFSTPEEECSEDDHRFKPFHDKKWQIRYTELLFFYSENGHAAVPHTYPSNPKLARWVKRQRHQYKLLQDNQLSTMTDERANLLDDLGFIWDSHGVSWREKFVSLKAYREANGHCHVPSNHSDKKLATWVKCQRRQYKLYRNGKACAMTPVRIWELEEVGFLWEIRIPSPKKRKIAAAAS